jgi:hypothetical protein
VDQCLLRRTVIAMVTSTIGPNRFGLVQSELFQPRDRREATLRRGTRYR